MGDIKRKNVLIKIVEKGFEKGFEKLRKKLDLEQPEEAEEKKSAKGSKKRKVNRAEAVRVWRKNDRKLRERAAQDAFVTRLHNNMVQDTGLLSVLSTMLQAAKAGDAARWEVYRGYACQQLQTLQKLEEAQKQIGKPSEDPGKWEDEKLQKELSRQRQLLEAAPRQTEYLPLYSCLKALPLQPVAAEALPVWLEETSRRLKESMSRLDENLQAAIRKEYPDL